MRFHPEIYGDCGDAPCSHNQCTPLTSYSRLLSHSECWLERDSAFEFYRRTGEQAYSNKQQRSSSRHALPPQDFLRGAILLQTWRQITPVPPHNYSSQCWTCLGFCGWQADSRTRDIQATINYSSQFWNYSDNCWKTLAIIGWQENDVAGVDLPAIEIYYYSTAE